MRMPMNDFFTMTIGDQLSLPTLSAITPQHHENASENSTAADTAASAAADHSPPASAVVERPAAETTLTSFAALLSSAQTNGLQHPLLSSGEPALAKFLSPKAEFDPANPHAAHSASFPGLSLRNRSNGGATSNGDMSIQDAAALNLAAPLRVDQHDIEKIPVTLLKNVSSSFLKLVDSRRRSSMAALLRQVAKLGTGSDETGVVVKLLSRRDPISVTTVVTSFRVLPVPEGGAPRGGGGPVRLVTLPLVFEAVVDASALGKLVTVALHAPGTITGTFHPEDGLLQGVEVAFDTVSLLKSMMNQARVVVKEAVARAAAVAAAAGSAARARVEASARKEQEALARRMAHEQQELEGTLHGHHRSLSAIMSFNSLANALAMQRDDAPSFEAAAGGSGNHSNWGGSHSSSSAPTLQDPFGADAFPQHLRDTMAQFSADKPPAPTRSVPQAPPSSQNYDQNRGDGGDHEDDATEGHSQPLTLSSLYARQDRENRESEERAARLRELSSAGGQRSGGTAKIELFSWLKGDSMLLEEDDLAVHAAAAHRQHQHQQQCTSAAGAAAEHISSSLGIPAAYAAGRLPHTFSSLSASDMLAQHAHHQEEEECRSSLPSCLSLSRGGNSSFAGMLKGGTGGASGRKRVSFSNFLKNESFGSQGSASKKLKKQVSFSLQKNDSFAV